MIIWIDQVIVQELTIQEHIIQEKAKWFTERLGIENFTVFDE